MEKPLEHSLEVVLGEVKIGAGFSILILLAALMSLLHAASQRRVVFHQESEEALNVEGVAAASKLYFCVIYEVIFLSVWFKAVS